VEVCVWVRTHVGWGLVRSLEGGLVDGEFEEKVYDGGKVTMPYLQCSSNALASCPPW
jgi:hypothetical protein